MFINQINKSFVFCCLALAFLCQVSTPADAYRMIQPATTGHVAEGHAVTCGASGGFAHWETQNIYWRHNTGCDGAGKQTPLQNAMAEWTAVAGAAYKLTYAGTTSAGWGVDGTNTILWDFGNGCVGNCLALTCLVIQSGHEIVESDITFNASYTWRTNGTDYDTEAVAVHELGHALGIHHTEKTSTPRPTMYASYFGTGGRSLESDDRSALVCSQEEYFPLSVSITRQGTWNPAQKVFAHASGGVPPFTYAWYRKPNCSGGGGEEDPADTGFPDKDVICSSWHGPFYTNPADEWVPYQGPNQNIRVDVTDSYGNIKTAYSWATPY